MFLVCGEALFDFFVEPDAAAWPRLSYQAVPGGSPFNVAIGLARLGQRSALLGGISEDYLGRQLLEVLRRENVDDNLLKRRALPTTLALVGLDATGHPQYSFYGDKAPEASLTEGELPALDDSVLGIHAGSYSLVRSPTAEALQALVIRECQQRLITLDPNIRLNVEPDLARWREVLAVHAAHAHLIKVSDEDLTLLYPEDTPAAAARRWLSPNCPLVIMTRGGQGASVFSAAHGEWHVAAQTIAVVDTVGAGDTFQAALLCWLAEHDHARPDAIGQLDKAQIDAMVRFAIRAAAITCTRRGPDLPRRADLA
ncbi:carbohydrate kinase [uncultured Aquitalea sp.]|uniref:carbohydrate kinase family protein n=1 Tax=uncultured Aquitalea sp. TaxID=540272 RepID=UPI0025EF7576|nr:carbohydrate kinase [uncultured Aquitalea sp.]